MMLVSLADKFFAIARRDLLTTMRYRTAFLLQFVQLLAELAGFYFLARAIGPEFRPQGMEYFPYLLVGAGLYGFVLTGTSSLVTAIHEAQMTGTMEVLLTTSTPPLTTITLTAASVFSVRALQMLAYLAGGVILFRVSLANANLPGSLLLFLMTLLVALAIGLIAAAVQIATHKGSALTWLLGSFGGLISGAMFPVAVLPLPLRALARLNPFTYAIEALRRSLLEGATLSQLTAPLTALAVSLLIALPASLVIFNWVVRRGRLQGTLSFY